MRYINCNIILSGWKITDKCCAILHRLDPGGIAIEVISGGCFGNTTTSHCPPDASHYRGEHDFCNNTSLGTIAVVGVIISIVAFSLAWGPIPWTSMSELIPGRVRSLYASIASMVNWSFATIITGCFQPYSVQVTPKFVWWSFSIIMFVSIFLVVIFLPEAKGVTGYRIG